MHAPLSMLPPNADMWTEWVATMITGRRKFLSLRKPNPEREQGTTKVVARLKNMRTKKLASARCGQRKRTIQRITSDIHSMQRAIDSVSPIWRNSHYKLASTFTSLSRSLCLQRKCQPKGSAQLG